MKGSSRHQTEEVEIYHRTRGKIFQHRWRATDLTQAEWLVTANIVAEDGRNDWYSDTIRALSVTHQARRMPNGKEGQVRLLLRFRQRLSETVSSTENKGIQLFP